jgi:ankyrin repeat protein
VVCKWTHTARYLDIAASGGHLETVKVLVEMGSDLRAQAKNGGTPLHVASASGRLETVRVLVEMGGDVRAPSANGLSPLHFATAGGHTEIVRVLVEKGGDLHLRSDANGLTPLHGAAAGGHLETVKLLVEMGIDVSARDANGLTPLQFAEMEGREAVVSFLRKYAKNFRRSKFTAVPVVDPAAQAAAEVVAAAMAALLIAEEEDQKQAPPSKQGNSNKSRKQRNRRKANLEELDTGYKGHDETVSSSAASSSGRRDNAGERDDMGRDAARHSKSDGVMDAHGGEGSAGLGCSNNGQSHNESEGIIGRNVQRVEASSGACDAGSSHSGVEQLTTTQAERRQEKERELKGKQRQRKRATTQATLEEALARVDHELWFPCGATAGVSLDTLNALDAAIVSTKRILNHGGASSSTDAPVVSSSTSSDALVVSSSTSSNLAKLSRQAEQKALNLRREMRAMAEAAAVDLSEEGLVRSAVAGSLAHIQEQQQSRIEPLPSATLLAAIALAESGSTCVVCLSAPKESLLLPCKHVAMCAECTKAVLTSSKQPQCPVCRSRIADCIYGVFF